jgi:hypothetical protein
MRILDPLSSRIDLAALGIMRQAQTRLAEAIAKPFGIILITGPTGSGKSTTIAGILKELNTEEVNIVTLEDPIEYFIDGVNQSQTHDEIGYTFANGLRSILRQDPDIIMVGEIRDPNGGPGSPVRPDGAHRAVHAAHERRSGRHPEAHRHGRREVPDAPRAEPGCCPTALAAVVSDVQSEVAIQ